MIVGVPSNDFGGQEPGTPADIEKTAHGDYGIGFPARRQGAGQGPEPASVLQMGRGERPLETPRWNFHKYLIGRDGHIAAVFATDHRADGRARHHRDREELPRPE